MLSAARTEEAGGYKVLLANDFHGLKGNANEREQRRHCRSESVALPRASSLDLKTRTLVTSDTLDIRGPIPLTRAAL